MVDTEAQDFGSGAGIVEDVLDGGGVFGLPEFDETAVPGPAAFDNLWIFFSFCYFRHTFFILKCSYLNNNSATNPFKARGAGSVPLRENLSAKEAKQRSAPSAT